MLSQDITMIDYGLDIHALIFKDFFQDFRVFLPFVYDKVDEWRRATKFKTWNSDAAPIFILKKVFNLGQKYIIRMLLMA